MTEQDLIGKNVKIVGLSTDGSGRAKGDFVAHICLDLEDGRRIFVQATETDDTWKIVEDRRYDLEEPGISTCFSSDRYCENPDHQ